MRKGDKFKIMGGTLTVEFLGKIDLSGYHFQIITPGHEKEITLKLNELKNLRKEAL